MWETKLLCVLLDWMAPQALLTLGKAVSGTLGTCALVSLKLRGSRKPGLVCLRVELCKLPTGSSCGFASFQLAG